ncbi:MAG: hypothetical protein P1U36_07935 [Legionellaceae bacterium]|nr:hypothetical protein [Legionellaceae bacterium]
MDNVERAVVQVGGGALAAQGARMVASNMPPWVVRFGYWLIDKKHTLRDEESIRAFNFLYEIIRPMSAELPGTHEDFRRQFEEHKERHNCVYVFSRESCFTITSLLKSLQDKEPFNGKQYKHCPLRAKIVTQISTLSSLRDALSQSVLKVFFRYILSLALELPYLHTAHDKLELIEHLHAVISKVQVSSQINDYFKEPERKVLRAIQTTFDDFISHKHAMHQADRLNLKNAVEI